MWQLCSEIAAALEPVAAALTVGQRQTAEKMLQQWERKESRNSKDAKSPEHFASICSGESEKIPVGKHTKTNRGSD